MSTEGTLLLTPDQVCEELGIGRSYLWVLMGRGEIQSLKLGKLRRIPRAALDEWLQRRLEEEGADETAEERA